MSRMHCARLGIAACAASLIATAALGGNPPVLTGSYSWEDGTGTVLGTFGSFVDPINTGPIDGVTPNTGSRMLRVTKADGAASAPQAYIAYIENLQHGDIITVGAMIFDDVPDTSYRGRLWGHYALSGDVLSHEGSASGPSTYTSGIGWEESTHTWVFDSDGDTRDALVIEFRGYTSADNTPFYVDDVWVEVYCAANPDLTITFADNLPIGDPDAPGPECEPGKPCTPTPLGDFGWEDEVSTAFNTTGNVTLLENVGPTMGVNPNSGNRMLQAQHGGGSAAQVWVAFIENLTDGDEVTASFFGYDDVPSASPRMRIWGHYAISGDPGSNAGSAGGNDTYTSGIGWEQLEHTWVFDSNGGTRDALMVEIRLYVPSGSTADYFIDDVAVDVCSDNPGVTVSFPDLLKPPVDACANPPSGTPTLDATFDWEDGTSTHLGWADGTITEANVTAPEPVNSGDHALRVTEAPHGDNPKVFMAYIEHLQNGDVIHGRFHAYDDSPGGAPEVRIWGRRVFSGDINSFSQSLGGNDDATSGDGWEELCHTWVFDGGPQNRDAMVIEARIYATPATCEECSTDFYLDDMYVGVWGNSNVTIQLPDGSYVGNPPLLCPADINNDSTVDEFDLFTVLGAWGTSDPDADINNDGTVDGTDLGILLASWGGCSKPYLAPAVDNPDLVVETTDLGGGQDRHDVYVQLNDAGDNLVSVYDANITFTSPVTPASYVAIGAAGPTVVYDPNFDEFEFLFFGTGVGTDGGWYNENPTNNLGLAGSYTSNRVLIGSFTMDSGEHASGTLSVSYINAEGRPIRGTASFDTSDVGTPCAGDLNTDGVVNVGDMLIVLGSWGPCPGCQGDINDDGIVNVGDLLILLSNWGTCN